ncbi:MAG: YggS family pyridoxal phosphate-dependent enzyme [Terrimicrobiaceae bacterium]
MSTIIQRLDEMRARMDAAARQAGRDPDAVGLVAVSKTHPAEAVREAFDGGQTIFGENRVQELLAKVPLLPAALRWHLIGHLQKNKIRKVLPVVELIHGVDTTELARDIDRVAAELGLFPRVLLEVNVSGEGTKFGFKPDDLRAKIEDLLALPRVQVEGLMTIAPYAEEAEASRPFFVKLRELRDEISTRTATPLPTLSMGMSGDFEVAIAEGSTLVRIGTAIFGERPKPSG